MAHSSTMTITSSLPIQSPALYAIILLASLIVYTIYQRFLHPLASIPGPFTASLSRLWLVRQTQKGSLNKVMINLHQRYGPLVRTGPNEISVSDLTAIKTIYSAGSKFRKGEWYSVWQGRRKFDLFAERDEHIHSTQRRLVSRPYSMESLKDLESFVDEALVLFLSKMDDVQDKVVDMKTWAQLFAFDVIGGITFSRLFGFMETGADDGTFGKIEKVLHSAAWVGQVPALFWLNDFLSPYIGNHLNANARNDAIRQYALREISSRAERGGNQKDILSKLFAIKSEKSAMDDGAVASMATSNIFAGSDTTAISVRAIIYYLLRNPACKERLLQEIEETWDNDNDIITLKQAEKMPYLQAVMYEALRLHPAVGMSLVRVVPEGGVMIAGKHIPAGTNIGANAWVIHRDATVYGEDVESFRPERWLEGNGDMHRFFLAFGAGSRMCIGRNISWMEMSKLIPTLFMHYDIHLCEPEKEWETTCWWFVMQHELDIRLRRRQA